MAQITDFTTILADTRTAALRFAVTLEDRFSHAAPLGNIQVRIQNRPFPAIKNRSGYYLFLNLPEDEYSVRVDAEYYFQRTLTVRTATLDPLNPVVSLVLSPRPSYPFPSSATLIRGTIEDGGGHAVTGAEITAAGNVRGIEITGVTTAKGEFVLYYPVLTEDEIIKEGGKTFVKGHTGTKTVALQATAGTLSATRELDAVEEGATTVLESPVIVT